MDRITNRLLKIFLSLTCLILLFYLFPHLKKLINTVILFVLPFILGFTFAFVFNPIVDYFEKKNIKRPITSIVILVFMLALLITILILLVPTLIKETQKLLTDLPVYLENFERVINGFLKKIKIENYEFKLTPTSIMDYINSNRGNIFTFFSKFIQGTFSYIILFIVTPILMLYFLIYYHKIIDFFVQYFQKKKWDKCSNIFNEIGITMRSYLKGILLVMVILTALSTICFMIIKLDLALLWGIIIGITNIIPYIGPYIGGIIVGIFTLSTNPSKILIVILLIILLQFIESNFITPQVNSKSIKTNPILVIFFVTLFGKLFGIIGMILAIPTLSVIQILLKSKNLGK